MVFKPLSPRNSAVLAQIGWIPVILSFLLLVVFVPFALLNRVFCLNNLVGIPLFAAYLGLLAFPLVAFLANLIVKKKFSVAFETKHKEILLAFWIWVVIAILLLFSFFYGTAIFLPGFDVYFSCT